MSLLGLPVPFGQTFERASSTLLNKALDAIFSPGSLAARRTVVVGYNHSDNPLFLVDTSFESGGFTPGMEAPFQIDPKTASAYNVESINFLDGRDGSTRALRYCSG